MGSHPDGLKSKARAPWPSCAGAELQAQTTARRGLHGAHTMAPPLHEWERLDHGVSTSPPEFPASQESRRHKRTGRHFHGDLHACIVASECTAEVGQVMTCSTLLPGARDQSRYSVEGVTTLGAFLNRAASMPCCLILRCRVL